MNADWMRSLIKSSAVPSSSATSLGAGFVEKVYENALAHELRSASLAVAQQYAIAVRYKDIIVGEYVADLLVANEILVELKAVRALDEIHAAQCMNYGKPSVEVRRIVLGFLTVYRTSAFIGVYRRFQSLRSFNADQRPA